MPHRPLHTFTKKASLLCRREKRERIATQMLSTLLLVRGAPIDIAFKPAHREPIIKAAIEWTDALLDELKL